MVSIYLYIHGHFTELDSAVYLCVSTMLAWNYSDLFII